VPIDLRRLYDEDDPGYRAWLRAVLDTVAQARQEIAARQGS